MKLWGNDDPNAEAREDQERSGIEGGDPLQDMILKMVAKNPAIANAFGGIQQTLQTFLATAKRIEEKQDAILYLLMMQNRHVLNNLPGLPTGEARGVINDGIRCVYCGSPGECLPDCPSHSDPAFAHVGPLPSLGDIIRGEPSGGSGDGGGSDLNSGGHTDPAATSAGA